MVVFVRHGTPLTHTKATISLYQFICKPHQLNITLRSLLTTVKGLFFTSMTSTSSWNNSAPQRSACRRILVSKKMSCFLINKSPNGSTPQLPIAHENRMKYKMLISKLLITDPSDQDQLCHLENLGNFPPQW